VTFFLLAAYPPWNISPIEVTKPVKKVELFVLDTGPGGCGPVKMGFLIDLEPGWHIYWANSGDAGLAPSVRWTLPPGFKAGSLLHPVPRKSVQEDIVSFEHDGPVLLTCDITPPTSARPPATWEASAVLEWMACRESCITGETAIRSVFPPDAAALEKAGSLLKTFAPRFPRPLSEAGLSVDTAHATITGAEWLVEMVLSGPRAPEADDFLPYPLDDFVIAHSRITCRDGRIVLPLTPSRGPGAPPPHAYVDLAAEKEISLGRGKVLSLGLNVYNLFNSQRPVSFIKEDTELFGQVWGRQLPRWLQFKLTFRF